MGCEALCPPALVTDIVHLLSAMQIMSHDPCVDCCSQRGFQLEGVVLEGRNVAKISETEEIW